MSARTAVVASLLVVLIIIGCSSTTGTNSTGGACTVSEDCTTLAPCCAFVVQAKVYQCIAQPPQGQGEGLNCSCRSSAVCPAAAGAAYPCCNTPGDAEGEGNCHDVSQTPGAVCL